MIQTYVGMTRMCLSCNKTLQTFKRLDSKAFLIYSLLCFWSGLSSIKHPSVARAAHQSQVWRSGKLQFRHLLTLLSVERPTARLVGPETMTHSPNRFALPCAGPFHKIHAGYKATTTTVNSSCLKYSYYFNAILLS